MKYILFDEYFRLSHGSRYNNDHDNVEKLLLKNRMGVDYFSKEMSGREDNWVPCINRESTFKIGGDAVSTYGSLKKYYWVHILDHDLKACVHIDSIMTIIKDNTLIKGVTQFPVKYNFYTKNGRASIKVCNV